jgi:hypothetical protein
LDLLLFEPQQWDVICVDDRALTKHAIRQENQTVVPMICVNELLSALLYNGEIDEQEYYNLLLELRQGNFRYIPIGEDEILYHLNLATIVNGRVIETEALRMLRQYHASCLLDKDFLRITDGPFSEVPFIIRGTEGIANAIANIWKDEKSSNEVHTARADWILNNLYTGKMGCSHLRNKTVAVVSVVNDVNLLAFDICDLIMRGLILDDNLASLGDIYKSNQYFEWLTERILTTRYISSLEILKAIAEELGKRFKIAQTQNYRTPQEKLYAGIFMGKFFLNLPENIAKEINFDQEMLDWLKVKIKNTVSAGEVNFDANEYWKSIEKVMAGEKVAIVTADFNKNYYFQLLRNEESKETELLFPTIEILDTENNQIDIVQDPSFGILAADVSTRLEVISKVRNWFDCKQEKFEKQASEIAQIRDTIERVTRFYNIRETSLVCYYTDIEARIRRRDTITWQELMPPSAESLVGYFRLPISTNSKTFSEIWSDAVDSLLNDEELAIVISRVASLPVKMPEKIIERFISLSDDNKAELLRKLSPVWASPIQLLHLANLAARSLPSANSVILDIAKELLNHLYESEDNTENFAAFRATLSFVSSEFYFWKEGVKLSTETALAVIWGHAVRLYNIERAVGMEPKDIVSGLSSRRESYFFESLGRKTEFWNDCAYPRRISQTEFLTQVAGNLFSGIDKTVLESLKIPELINNNVFSQNNEDEVPITATKLLSDPTLCSNRLQSLFGGDRFDVLSPVIGDKNIDILKSENLKQSVKTFLENMINDPNEAKGWIMVYAIITDLPIYEDLRDLCFSVLKAATTDSLYQNDIGNPVFILFAATSQVANFGNENLRTDFREKLIEVLKKLEADANFKENLEVHATLMDAALALSYVPEDSSKSNKEFSSLIEEISNEWENFTNDFRHAFANTFWNTPLIDSEGWRHLNLKLRIDS